jgi:hypothetical protein
MHLQGIVPQTNHPLLDLDLPAKHVGHDLSRVGKRIGLGVVLAATRRTHGRLDGFAHGSPIDEVLRDRLPALVPL